MITSGHLVLMIVTIVTMTMIGLAERADIGKSMIYEKIA